MTTAPFVPEEGVPPTTEPEQRVVKKTWYTPLAILREVLVYLFLIVILALACVTIVIPKFAGAVPMTILSNSMAPAIPVGSLAVVIPTMKVPSATNIATLSPEQIAPLNKVDNLGSGVIIAFQPEAGSGTLVIHRIVGVSVRADGSREFTTRGDNNTSSEVVQDYMIRGKVWYHLPYLGFVNNYLNGSDSPRHVIAVALAVTLYLWAAILIYRGSRRDESS
ncbi:hypothetical protein [Rhodococcus sp. BH5]|uniref:hypothetical protein n=1 Tax=Rhodococcus sp. BH5 TaxID=2871702 RepID=UPI0022CD3231|nr:hypothetical protein [Rhodococcus sp. BH5]MCZ9635392.1 S26 family signal peptidase [Rhodococcus sp. BH5]